MTMIEQCNDEYIHIWYTNLRGILYAIVISKSISDNFIRMTQFEKEFCFKHMPHRKKFKVMTIQSFFKFEYFDREKETHRIA